MNQFVKWVFERSAVRFLIAGLGNTLATYGFYLVLIQFLSYQVAYTVTYISGILIGYLANGIWVFRSRPTVRSAIAYPIAYLVQYLTGILILSAAVEILSMDSRIAPLLVITVTIPMMFLLTRTIFSKGNIHHA